jgi:hypothetical protein
MQLHVAAGAVKACADEGGEQTWWHLQLLVGGGGQRNAAISFAHEHVVLEVAAAGVRGGAAGAVGLAHASMCCWAAAAMTKPSPAEASPALPTLLRKRAIRCFGRERGGWGAAVEGGGGSKRRSKQRAAGNSFKCIAFFGCFLFYERGGPRPKPCFLFELLFNSFSSRPPAVPLNPPPPHFYKEAPRIPHTLASLLSKTSSALHPMLRNEHV